MATTNFKRSDTQCSVIAFYGFKLTSERRRILWNRLKAWFIDLGHEATFASLIIDGRTGQTKKLNRVEATLRENQFRSVTGFSLLHMPGSRKDLFNTPLSAGYSDQRNGYIVLDADSAICDLSSPTFIDVSIAVARIANPAYGIGYRRRFGDGGAFYATGILMGPSATTAEQEFEEEQIAGWASHGMAEHQVYLKGELRDVYPLNYLTSAQLHAVVDNVTLEQWIKADAKRGKLRKVSAKMSLWEIADDRIPAVRSALWEAGRLFDHRKYREEAPPGWTAEDSLAAIIGDCPPRDLIILDGSGREIPTAEVEQKIKRTKKTRN